MQKNPMLMQRNMSVIKQTITKGNTGRGYAPAVLLVLQQSVRLVGSLRGV
jgi:hypothetical protein